MSALPLNVGVMDVLVFHAGFIVQKGIVIA
jgi:hypothetical protein